MPINFTCKCGKRLQAKTDHAGKRVQCPACGRALVTPTPPAEQKSNAGYLIDASPQAADKAHRAGVVRRGSASVVLLHSGDLLKHDVTIEGHIQCWHCKAEPAFTGHVFGRTGLTGDFITILCPQCRAKLWIGFSNNVAGQGTNIFLYTPSHTRENQVDDNAPLPDPTFRVERMRDRLQTGSKPDMDVLHTLLPDFVQKVSHREPYQAVSGLAAKLVEQRMTTAQVLDVNKSLNRLLSKQQTTYLRAIIVETLACLRDETAAQAVQTALRDSLVEEDASDKTNQPLHDLCTLALLFGDGNGFLLAMDRGLRTVEHPTRACKFGKALTPLEIFHLMEEEGHIDTFETTLGGNNWQAIHPLLPLWVDEGFFKPKEDNRKGWLSRLFGQ